jgi:energy-coupling factor transporter ATP-binding protein EcfA2
MSVQVPSQRRVTITSIELTNFKAFARFSVSLQSMNILVGPNNCGKSTLLGAFRALEVGLRRGRSRNPERVPGPRSETLGYNLSQDLLPISIENVHTDYADTKTTVSFRLSNGNKLLLYFPEDGGCILIAEPLGRAIANTSAFKAAYPISIAVVPVLGPVEHEEEVRKQETVQKDLGTHRASRHFRNYWYYFREGFDEFAALVERTWPTMQIQAPERLGMSEKLSMFCLERRITRELYWAGFGFQIWCQLLTHLSRAANASLLVVDEPEVYLHPDVQRQLLSLLRTLGPDVLLATHSTEILAEADPSEIALIDKTKRSASRLRDVEGVQQVLDIVGSQQNITLTRLAKNRRVLFVEGEHDYTLLRLFARQLNLTELESGVDITGRGVRGFRFVGKDQFPWVGYPESPGSIDSSRRCLRSGLLV